MTKPVDGALSDQELVLAKLLESRESQTGDSMSASTVLSGLSAQQQEEYEQARECLQILQLACPPTFAETQQIGSRKTEPATTSTPDLAIPQRLGRFQIIRQLGIGGFGIVMLARDVELERYVALKIPKTETLIQPQHRRRFEREAKAAAMLSHPQIVPIHETGRLGPVFYIAYAWVDGPTLAQWLDTHGIARSTNDRVGLDSKIAARMVAALADAVQHAHCRGVFHRDLKPGNIMIDTADFDPNSRNQKTNVEIAFALRITDFGLAAFENNDDGLTQAGTLMGTPAYMAPEQIKGNCQASAAADIYSLGIILFELLTGRLPWQNQNSLELMNEITNQPVPSPRKFNPGVSRDLSAITLKCLEKNPASRYATAGELCDDLNRLVDGVPVRARQRSCFNRFVLWMRRNPTVAGLTTLLILSLVAGLAATASQYRKSQLHLRQTQASFSQAKQVVDDMLSSAMSSDLEAMPGVRKDILGRALRYYQEFVSQRESDPDLKWELVVAYRKLAAINAQMGDRQEALKYYQLAAEIINKHFAEDASLEVQLEKFVNQIDIGLQYNNLRQLENALDAYDIALESGAILATNDPENPEVQASLARVYKNKGYVLFEQQEIEKAGKFYHLALEIRKSLVEKYPENEEYISRLARSHASFSAWYLHKRDFHAGLENAKQYRALFGQLVQAHPANLQYRIHHANADNKLSDVWRLNRDQENWSEPALNHLNRAIDQQLALVAEYPLHAAVRSHLINSYLNLGDVYRYTDDIPSSLAQYEKAVDCFDAGQKLSGVVDDATNATLALLYMRIGDRLWELRQNRRALRSYTESQTIYKNLMASSDHDKNVQRYLRILVKQGKIEMQLGNADVAQELFQRHLDAGGDHSGAKLFLAHLLVLTDQGKSTLDRARELCRDVLQDHPESTHARAQLGLNLFHRGKYLEAIEIVDEATRIAGRKRYESFVRAMCLHRLGEVQQANMELKIANDWFERSEHQSDSKVVFLAMQRTARGVLSE